MTAGLNTRRRRISVLYFMSMEKGHSATEWPFDTSVS